MEDLGKVTTDASGAKFVGGIKIPEIETMKPEEAAANQPALAQKETHSTFEKKPSNTAALEALDILAEQPDQDKTS